MQYKCSNCGGELAFDPSSQKLRCPYCGESYDIESFRQEQTDTAHPHTHEQNHEHIHEHGVDYAAGMADENQTDRTSVTPPPILEGQSIGKEEVYAGTVEEVRDDRIKENDGLSAYACPHCAAHIVAEQTSAALVCPFCKTPLVVEEQIRGRFAPAGIVPFAIDKKKLGNLYETYIRSKPFYPEEYSAKHVISKIKGVYLPFWLYDMDLEGEVIGKGEKTITRRQGEYQVTDHMVYHLYRSGSLGFEAVPVIAASNAQEAALNAIEPYDYSRMQSFSPDFMAGFMAQRYDQDENEKLPRCHERTKASFEKAMLNTMAGYQGLSVYKSDVHPSGIHSRYVLLPVWLLYMDYDKASGEDGLIAINGQTGAIAGNIPVDKHKRNRFFVRWLLIFFVLFAAIALTLMIVID